MRKRVAIAALATVATVALPCVARAQLPAMTLTAGVGGAWAGTTCSGCIATNDNGASGLLQLGVQVLPALRVGVEWNRWTDAQFGEPGRLDFVMAVADFYPITGGSLFLKGGVGRGHMRFRLSDPFGGAPSTAEQSGFAYSVGVGYDVPLGRRLTVAPYLQLLTTRKGAGRIDDLPIPDQTADMLQYGVSLRLR